MRALLLSTYSEAQVKEAISRIVLATVEELGKRLKMFLHPRDDRFDVELKEFLFLAAGTWREIQLGKKAVVVFVEDEGFADCPLEFLNEFGEVSEGSQTATMLCLFPRIYIPEDN